jgi:hypothetical protein
MADQTPREPKTFNRVVRGCHLTPEEIAVGEEFAYPSPCLPPSPFDPPQTAPQPPRSKGPWIILLVVGGLLVVPCLCGGIFLVLAGRGVSTVLAERGNVEQVVNQYLQKMEDKDIAGAYALFSPASKRTIPQSKVAELVEGENYVIFSDFKRATVTNIHIHSSLSRTVARVQGTVAYEDGVAGSFQGVVGREGDTWMIDGMHVTVPPAKLAAAKSK